MKLSLLAAYAIFISITGVNAQSHYYSGFDNTEEQAGWQEFKKGTVLQTQHWNYQSAQAFSAPTCLMHLYPVGGTQPTDNWFVSPSFSVANGGTLDSLRYGFSGFGTPQAGDTVFIYLLNGNADPALATSATILHEFSGANYQNDNLWRLLAPISLPAHPGNSYIAFRYKTIVNWLDVRFDNIAWTGTSTANINDENLIPVNVYPNPVTNSKIHVDFDPESLSGDVTMKIFNTSGQLVHSSAISSKDQIDLALAPGYYAYQLHHASGVVANGKVVIIH